MNHDVVGIRIFESDEIRRTIDVAGVMDAVSSALSTFSMGRSLSPPISFIQLENGGEVHLKSGYARGAAYFATKLAMMVPANRDRGIPTSNGLMLLCSAITGYPVALLHDRKYLTDIRTAAVGAIAARLLAPRTPAILGILGTGGQAVLQGVAVTLVRPVERVVVWGRSAGNAEGAARRLQELLPGTRVTTAASAEEVVRIADHLITATAARSPLVRGEWLRPGTHVTAIGADDTAKAELDAECFRRAAFVACDSRALALRFGEIPREVAAGRLSADCIHAELGQLLTGAVAYERSPEHITISKHVGIGIEDLFVAVACYEKAIAQRGAES